MSGRLIEALRRRLARRSYRRAMLAAIGEASEPSEIWGACNRADGLRAIRAFERLNGRPFNPFDKACRSVVRGTGPRQRRARAAYQSSRHPAAHISQGE